MYQRCRAEGNMQVTVNFWPLWADTRTTRGNRLEDIYENGTGQQAILTIPK